MSLGFSRVGHNTALTSPSRRSSSRLKSCAQHAVLLAALHLANVPAHELVRLALLVQVGRVLANVRGHVDALRARAVHEVVQHELAIVRGPVLTGTLVVVAR